MPVVGHPPSGSTRSAVTRGVSSDRDPAVGAGDRSGGGRSQRREASG